MLIYFCETCGFRIPTEELNSGKAIQDVENKYNCAKCASAMVEPPSKPSSEPVVKAQPHRTLENSQQLPHCGGANVRVRLKSTNARRTSTQKAANGSSAALSVRKALPLVLEGVALILTVVVVVALMHGPKNSLVRYSSEKKSEAGTSASIEHILREKTPAFGVTASINDDSVKQAERAQPTAGMRESSLQSNLRNKCLVVNLETEIERKLSPLKPGLAWEFCQPEGGDRFKIVKAAKVLHRLNQSWGDNEPEFGAPKDFSARANGVLRIEKAGRYAFSIRADDYGLLQIDGKRVAEAPSFGVSGEGEVELSVGDHSIQIEFMDTGLLAELKIHWRLAGVFETQNIPDGALFHDPRKLSCK